MFKLLPSIAFLFSTACHSDALWESRTNFISSYTFSNLSPNPISVNLSAFPGSFEHDCGPSAYKSVILNPQTSSFTESLSVNNCKISSWVVSSTKLVFEDSQKINPNKKIAKLPFSVERDFYRNAKIKWIDESGEIHEVFGALPFIENGFSPNIFSDVDTSGDVLFANVYDYIPHSQIFGFKNGMTGIFLYLETEKDFVEMGIPVDFVRNRDVTDVVHDGYVFRKAQLSLPDYGMTLKTHVDSKGSSTTIACNDQGCSYNFSKPHE